MAYFSNSTLRATINYADNNNIGHGSRLAGDTTSRLQVARSTPSKDGFFGFLSEKKKSSLPGGQSHYSLQRTVGGSFGTRG